MKEGSVVKKVNDWRQYKARRLSLEDNKFFQPNSDYSSRHYRSCGSAALSLLTNIKVETVERFCPNPKQGWATSRIIKYLKWKGYVVIELSKNGILSHGYFNGDPALTNNHCLLINAHADSEENSLFILHKSVVYHHFHVQSVNDPLFFFNQPTQDVLLVWHKKWAEPEFNPWHPWQFA